MASAIREARLAVRLTQEQLGLKARAVYRWECAHSVPRRRVRRALLQALHYRSPEAAAKLAAVFVSHTTGSRATIAVAPVAPPPMLDALAFELAISAMADDLDVAPRRVRASLAALLARVAEAGFSLEAARSELALRTGATV